MKESPARVVGKTMRAIYPEGVVIRITVTPPFGLHLDVRKISVVPFACLFLLASFYCSTFSFKAQPSLNLVLISSDSSSNVAFVLFIRRPCSFASADRPESNLVAPGGAESEWALREQPSNRFGP